MGNSATKEQRQHSQFSRPDGSYHEHGSSSMGGDQQIGTDGSHQLYSSRPSRGSRSELSTFLGMSHGNERDVSSLETRRETKAEREARKLERERVNREKERERSMREENVDGGYLVTQGVYTGIEDYSKPIVRQLMIERRLAPFWRGLNEHWSSWTEHQLVAVAKGLPLPAADEMPAEEAQEQQTTSDTASGPSEQPLSSLTVPIASRTQSVNSDSSPIPSPPQTNISLPSSAPNSGSALLRGRAKTMASITTASKSTAQPELQPREINLPKNPNVNGQPIGAYLYKDASECPICFLYYPPYLNRTRCCDQSICSECFVQIKRPDPHPPEHADPNAPQPPQPPQSPSEDGSGEQESTLVSEPAACPFCVQPEFGVTYEPPPFQRGLTYANSSTGPQIGSSYTPMSSDASLSSTLDPSGRLSPTSASRRRTTSLSANASTVITTDRIRPDWANKLASARAHAARRSAAATALHTAAYLMGNRSPDPRGFGFGRRNVLRRHTGSYSPSSGMSSSNLGMLAFMAERYGQPGNDGNSNGSEYRGSFAEPTGPTMEGPPRNSSRRNRMDDLEEMMMMEAIRLSLASEEDRRKREEKDAKKEAKKRSKEEKKAEKAARRGRMYPSSANQSSGTLDSPQSGSFSLASGKGKAIAKTDDDPPSDLDSPLSRSAPHAGPSGERAQQHLERSRAQIMTTGPDSASSPASPAFPSAPHRPSHLRNLSNVSSASSNADSLLHGGGGRANVAPGYSSSVEPSPVPGGTPLRSDFADAGAPTPPGGGAGTEPMFNFRSLAAMIDHEEREGGEAMVEHREYAVRKGSEGEEEGEGDRAGDGEAPESVEQSGEAGAATADTAGGTKQSAATPKPSLSVEEAGNEGTDHGSDHASPDSGRGLPGREKASTDTASTVPEAQDPSPESRRS